MIKAIHVSAECYPIAKVGGLADVVGALPKYQEEAGIETKVVMPFYQNSFTEDHTFKTVYKSEVSLGEQTYKVNLKKLKKNVLDIDVLFIDIPELLFKDFVYSENDTERFVAFQIAVMDWILSLNEKPSIIHCHDHHTGLIPFMAQECYAYESLNKIPIVFSIHNAQYQGWFSHDKLYYFPEFNINNVGLLDWDGQINPLAAAIKCAWRVTTVSPNYMKELQHSANGLESLLSHENQKCVGILNGIDAKVWNPETDAFIEKNYSEKNIQTGKTQNKKLLCKKFSFTQSKPLFAFIGRLVYEKSADLLPQVFEHLLQQNNCNILILGSGNKVLEDELQKLKEKFPSNYNHAMGYDEKLSHQIYAGADFLLMPSRIEPCGLNQMYAMRYATVPIVNKTGGLQDTVKDISKKGIGFTHEEATVDQIVNAAERAIEFYENKTKLKEVRKKMMQLDHSWNNAAKEYINLYKSI